MADTAENLTEERLDEIFEKIPWKKDAENKAKRQDMFKLFDPNGNGILSLAELDKAMRDVLVCDELFDCKPAIMRAFQIANKKSKKEATNVDLSKYVTFSEFRFFLVALRMYMEYWVAFKRVDDNDDRKIDLGEFKANFGVIGKWVEGLGDAEATFAEIDANGQGAILFDEFSSWAIEKHLDLEDSGDVAYDDLSGEPESARLIAQ